MTKLPYDYPKPAVPGQPCIENKPCAMGRELGAHLVRLTQGTEKQFYADSPGYPQKCHDCAFRLGSEPNGMLPTVAAALKCVVEGDSFFHCHHGQELICTGYLIAIHGQLKSKEATP